jgi:diguanylate cyclase (GGDEF)-like protein
MTPKTGPSLSSKPVFRLLGLLLLAPSIALAGAEPIAIHTAAQVHDLPPAAATRHLPVHLIATVTYYEPAEHTLFVADASGAVYVKTTHPYPLHRGDLVTLDGVTEPSFRTVVASDPVIRVIGRRDLAPAQIRTYQSYEELMSGKWDCRYVAMRGLVRSAVLEKHGAEDVLELEILMPGGLVQGYVQEFSGIDTSKLSDAEVEISGVVGGEFNAKWQLMRSIVYAGDRHDIRILRPAKQSPKALPLTSVDQVMQTYSVADRTRRVRVRGAVTYYRSGNSIVVQQQGQSLFATTRHIGDVPLGSVVDLAGFAHDGGYGPELGQADIFPTGGFNPIKPVALTYQQAMYGTYNDDLVSVTGTLISELHTDTSDTLSLIVDQHAVTAILQSPDDGRWLPNTPIGAQVSVTGICRITPMGTWGTPGMTPMLFRLNMRTRDDLKVLSLPSWWTVTHLVVAIGALLSVSLLIAIWAIVLRRRVAAQTATIQMAMRVEQERSRLLEAINTEASLEDLIEDIRSSIEKLAPGLKCAFSIAVDQEQDRGTPQRLLLGESADPVLFEAKLCDNRGVEFGWLRAGGHREGSLSSFDQELLEIATGLTTLVVNQRRMYEELNYTSEHDQLTGLPNRRVAEAAIEEALEQAHASGSRFCVAYVDVDEFKRVNDQYGHKMGDTYLQEIAKRLSTKVRKSDKLARIGGDEFLLVACGLQAAEAVDAYRQRLETSFAEPFVLDATEICGSASIGFAVFPDHGTTAEELKRHADMEMYAAKHRRRRELGPCTPEEGETDIFSPADIEAALRNHHFRLFYQPQFSSQREFRGLEALLRLDDPILGMVSPDAFIGVAERSDVILPLGDWVLRQALSDAATWKFDSMENVRMVVNVSARQIEHPGYADQVLAALKDSGMPPGCLELEITERTVARDVAEAARQLQHLHQKGVRISIDDFGTGNSSLSTLHHLPIDTLKIDRSFVRELSSQADVFHIIRAIVSMAVGMNKRIVAEGVETEEEIALLLDMADMDLQGFLLGRPQPFHQVSNNLAGWRAHAKKPLQA